LSEQPRYDLFLSRTGIKTDKEQAQRLYEALGRLKLRVFLDEHDIGHFESINGEIEAALRSSRALLAYYSEHFTNRPACQWELTAAFLAGHREGDPMRRIIVVNPRDPNADHLLPAELADAKYVVPGRDDPDAMARSIADRVRALTGVIGPLRFTDPPRSYDRVLGSLGFVGRYREQWELHTALVDPSLPLTREPTAAPVVSLVGMPGIGKSAIAAAYAWFYGAAYAGGGVHWLSLADGGRTPDELLGRYAAQVRSVADGLGLQPGDGVSRERLFGLVGDHLYNLPGPSLWIIDDVPDDLDPLIVHQLVVPGGSQVRTVLITHTSAYAAVARPVVVGPMTDHDAELMLNQYRTPDDSEKSEVARLISRLGGHPFTIEQVGGAVRDRHGLVGIVDYLDGLSAASGPLSLAADLLRGKVTGLPPVPRLVLRLAAAAAPVGPPAALLAAVVEAFPGLDGGPDATGAAVSVLSGRQLAKRDGAVWSFHSLVREAARRHVDPPVTPADLANATAAALVRLARGRAAEPSELALLIRHAEALITGGETAVPAEDTLRRLVAQWYEGRGEPLLAAGHRDVVAARNPAAPADQAAAAMAWLAGGEPERAVELAGRALALPSEGDALAAYLARRTLAESLDALGKYEEADPYWAVLSERPAPDDAAAVITTRARFLRGLRLRGHLAELKPAARELITALAERPADTDPAVRDAVQDAAQAAQLELARAEALTDGQRSARGRATAVIEHYRQRGVPEHMYALDAQQVLVESTLTLHLWELWPDKDEWIRAEQQAREQRDQYRASHGPNNVLTLTAAVQHTYILVSLGRRDDGRAELATLQPALAGRLGERHPLTLRAMFLSGLIHGQLQQYAQARPLYEQALAGQRSVLGRRHPHTLRTQYELAIALRLTGDGGWQPMMAEVAALAPAAVGRVNDLYTQAKIALQLLRLPTWAIRAATRAGRPNA
jgi:tetratricopeptide (TPR) repeat protein